MNATVIPSPEVESVNLAKASGLADTSLEVANSYQVDSPAMFNAAADELKAIKTRRSEIEELRLSLTRPLDEAKRRIMDLFRLPTERLDQAEAVLKRGMLSFQNAEREKQEQARREAEARARVEREEAERRQRAAEAEERRIREEAAAKERQAREDAEAARRAGDEAAARAAEALAEQERHQAEIAANEAAEVAQAARDEIELAEVAPPSLPTVVVPTAAGISTRQTWKAEVTDLVALVKAAAKAHDAGDPTLMGYLLANETAIGQVARALKAQTRIPGVRVYAQDSMAVRRSAA